MEEEEKVKEFWNRVKDNGYWSGGIVNLGWDDLWEEARENIELIYKEARDAGTHAQNPEMLFKEKGYALFRQN